MAVKDDGDHFDPTPVGIALTRRAMRKAATDALNGHIALLMVLFAPSDVVDLLQCHIGALDDWRERADPPVRKP